MSLPILVRGTEEEFFGGRVPVDRCNGTALLVVGWKLSRCVGVCGREYSNSSKNN